MTGNQSKFVNLSRKDDGLVTFGDNKEGKIIGKGTIGNDSGSLIENVLLVDGLQFDESCNDIFNESICRDDLEIFLEIYF